MIRTRRMSSTHAAPGLAVPLNRHNSICQDTDRLAETSGRRREEGTCYARYLCKECGQLFVCPLPELLDWLKGGKTLPSFRTTDQISSFSTYSVDEITRKTGVSHEMVLTSLRNGVFRTPARVPTQLYH